MKSNTTTTKSKLVFLFVLMLFACNTSKEKSSVDKNKNTSSKSCNFEQILQDPKTTQLAKEIFQGKAKTLSDNEALAYFEKLKSKSQQDRNFYFKVITKSYSIADGAYAEGLGYEAKNFLEDNPYEFTEFIDNQDCITLKDLSVWVDMLIGEFTIEQAGERDNSFIDEYIHSLRKGCKKCSSSQLRTIHMLDLALKVKLNQYLKNNESDQ